MEQALLRASGDIIPHTKEYPHSHIRCGDIRDLFFARILGRPLVLMEFVGPVMGLDLALLDASLIEDIGDELLRSSHREIGFDLEDKRDSFIDLLMGNILYGKRGIRIVFGVKSHIEFQGFASDRHLDVGDFMKAEGIAGIGSTAFDAIAHNFGFELVVVAP